MPSVALIMGRMVNVFTDPKYDHTSQKFVNKAYVNVYLFFGTGVLLFFLNALQVRECDNQICVNLNMSNL